MSPICPNCAMTNSAGATFCRHCGASLAAAPGPPASYGSHAPAPPSQAPYGSYGPAPSYPPPPAWPQQPPSAPLPPPAAQSYPPSYQSYPPAPSYQPGAYVQPGAPYGHAQYGYAQPVPASAIARWAAHFIDFLLMLIALPFTVIPILGAIVTFLIIIPYWLLRDMTGGGIGKRLLGLEIIQVDGTPPRPGPRILRNITLGAPWICTIVPGLGHALFFFLAFVIYLTELVLVVVAGRRLGDRLAGTMVVKKRR